MVTIGERNFRLPRIFMTWAMRRCTTSTRERAIRSWRSTATRRGHSIGGTSSVTFLPRIASSPPITSGWDAPTNRHSTNLVHLIDHLDLKDITLLGHDWGGAIGLGAMMQRPDRFKQFVMFNTGAFPPPSVPRRIAVCRTPLLGRFAVQGMNMFAKAAVKMATTQRGGLNRTARDGMLAPYGSWNDRIGIYQFVADIPFNDKHKTWLVLEQLETQLPEFSHLPSMLVWGMQDWCFDVDCLKKFEELLPNSTVHRLMNAGHWVVEDAATEVTVLLKQFLAGDHERAKPTIAPPANS